MLPVRAQKKNVGASYQKLKKGGSLLCMGRKLSNTVICSCVEKTSLGWCPGGSQGNIKFKLRWHFSTWRRGLGNALDQMPRGHGKAQDSSPKQTQGQSGWTLTHPSKRKAEPSAPPRSALPSRGQECDGATQEGCSPIHRVGRSNSQPWLPRDPSPREVRAGWTQVPDPEVGSRSGGSRKADLTSHVPAPPR